MIESRDAPRRFKQALSGSGLIPGLPLGLGDLRQAFGRPEVLGVIGVAEGSFKGRPRSLSVIGFGLGKRDPAQARRVRGVSRQCIWPNTFNARLIV